MPEGVSKLRMERRDAIEAYIGQDGHVCLKQEDSLGHDDIVIALEPSQVPMVVKWLEHLAGESMKNPMLNEN